MSDDTDDAPEVEIDLGESRAAEIVDVDALEELISDVVMEATDIMAEEMVETVHGDLADERQHRRELERRVEDLERLVDVDGSLSAQNAESGSPANGGHGSADDPDWFRGVQ